jgi:hypothetical protein
VAQFRTLVSKLASARSYTTHGVATFSEGRTEQKAARAGSDVDAFIRYVRAT